MWYLGDLNKVWSEFAQSCLTLCDPVDCSPPGCSVHGSLQARIMEWVVISFSRGSSRPRDQTQVSCIAGRRFNLWAAREALAPRIKPELLGLPAHAYLSNLIQHHTHIFPSIPFPTTHPPRTVYSVLLQPNTFHISVFFFLFFMPRILSLQSLHGWPFLLLWVSA